MVVSLLGSVVKGEGDCSLVNFVLDLLALKTVGI